MKNLFIAIIALAMLSIVPNVSFARGRRHHPVRKVAVAAVVVAGTPVRIVEQRRSRPRSGLLGGNGLFNRGGIFRR